MFRFVTLVALLALAAGPARADGLYFAESFGVGIARGELEPIMGQPLHVRLGVGGRFGDVAIEAWMMSDMQLHRDNAFKGVIGGDPPEGTADLASYGIDARYIIKIDPVLSTYVRAGPSRAEATGVLAGYEGYGFGVGGGFQISGKVRALGFLWTPLFFLKRGPKITGALYLDQGYDFYRLRLAGAPNINARIGHVSVGFALGQAF